MEKIVYVSGGLVQFGQFASRLTFELIHACWKGVFWISLKSDLKVSVVNGLVGQSLAEPPMSVFPVSFSRTPGSSSMYTRLNVWLARVQLKAQDKAEVHKAEFSFKNPEAGGRNDSKKCSSRSPSGR